MDEKKIPSTGRIATIIHSIASLFGETHSVIDLRDGRRRMILVRDGYQMQKLDDTRTSRRMHQVADLQSLIAYGTARIHEPGIATLFCSEERFALLIDDDHQSPGTAREVISYQPTPTKRFMEWMNTGKMRHVDFARFLDDHVDDVEGGRALLPTILKFGYRSEVSYNADLEDGKSMTFMVSTGQTKGQAKLPKEITVNVPVFEGLDEIFSLRFRLDFEEGGERDKSAVIFRLDCRNKRDVTDGAVTDLVSRAKAGLPGILIVRGTLNFGGSAE